MSVNQAYNHLSEINNPNYNLGQIANLIQYP